MTTKNSSRFTPLVIAVSIVAGILIGTFYAKHYGGNKLGIVNGSSNKLNALLRVIDNQYVDTVNISDLVEKAMPQILAELVHIPLTFPPKKWKQSTPNLKEASVEWA